MTTFKITLTRYANGERRNNVMFRTAENFEAAVSLAENMVRASNCADLTREYSIAAIEVDGLRVNEETYDGWETEREFSERIALDGA